MGRIQTEETKQKIRESLLGRKRPDLAEYFKNNPHKRYTITSEKAKENNRQRMIRMSLLPWDEAPQSEKRRRVLFEQNGVCNRCGIDSWNESPLTLELEHINGIHSDNSRDNLEILCPNCHSQTPTYRNKKRA